MMKVGMAVIAGGAALLGPASETAPSALAQASPGLWELRRMPEGKPALQCVADVSALAQVEHLKASCMRNVVSKAGTNEVLRYSCVTGGFGQSKLTALTPRSITIETQGISDGLPFNYVVHARRVGDCPGH